MDKCRTTNSEPKINCFAVCLHSPTALGTNYLRATEKKNGERELASARIKENHREKLCGGTLAVFCVPGDRLVKSKQCAAMG